MIRKISLLLIILVSTVAYSQSVQDNKYKYSVDLNNVSDDKLTIELITPKISNPTAKFMMPAMVPGTYSVYNFGRFISDLKAFDNSGSELSVTKGDLNTWEISNAENLYKITYKVRQTYGDKEDPKVFEPVGTDIDEGKVFAFNNQGFFGYIEGMVNNEYELKFSKPQGFYGATSLPALRDDKEEIFPPQIIMKLLTTRSCLLFLIPRQ
ncbi:MAG: hypothetical protein IPG99_16645 [Ignavibacteria bacterium]|nr:hypothetical protein [Ignavibacteria bacterium]